MNFFSYRRIMFLFIYCGVAVLVIVNGQSTTDDDIDKNEVSRDTVEELRAELQAEFRAEIAELRVELAKSTDRNMKLEKQLATSIDRIATLEGILCLLHLTMLYCFKFAVAFEVTILIRYL